jgi:epoxyqueuosine reductase
MVAPRLDELAALTPEAFRERFAGTPVLRAKHRGLLRNVEAARANRPVELPGVENRTENLAS